MFTLETVTKSSLYIVKEIVNSNEDYNKCENGRSTRTNEEIYKEFIHENPNLRTSFIKVDDTYIGLVETMDEKDGYPWLGLFMIHRDYHRFGYGTNAYYFIEEMLRKQGKVKLRLGVLQNNEKAKLFWKHVGYTHYARKRSNKGMVVDCYEKELLL
ncbi:GNAT family N-acetyltransferase [Ectobacillus sp. sgz5001026]|uniref:GNAT family N-acetyltransferase n=1 Tax=Ectobacillus sp. sgz5001026 TaxID=3242473 RepID=UPI0036D31D92